MYWEIEISLLTNEIKSLVSEYMSKNCIIIIFSNPEKILKSTIELITIQISKI